MVYKTRIIDSLLKEELQAFGGVLLTGPKWCGKTTSAGQIAQSILSMQSPENQEVYLQMAELTPMLLLEGKKPRLLDEWQMAPQLWDAVRHVVDQKGDVGLYILTGSTSVDEKKIKHSGAGRISRLKMYTMSLFESGDSTGSVSIADLFSDDQTVSAHSDLSVKDYARLLVRGGWPGMLGNSEAVNRRQIAGYCDAIVKSDITTVDGVSRDERKVTSILRSYARHTASQASNSTILKDFSKNDESIHRNTLESYLAALNRLFVIDDLPAWSPKLRSRTAIRISDTRHFTDPAIAAYFLQASPRDLLYDPNTFGLLFESLVIRDLRVYSQALRGTLSHYRDKSGLEADAIIHLSDGRWAAIEVKLGAKQIDEAAENLIALRDKVDTDWINPPSFLMIITATEYAYQRKDGVYVVPLGCLSP